MLFKLYYNKRLILLVTVFINVSIYAQYKQSDSLAATPPMGWMSWYTFIDHINEQLIMDIADSMVSTGLRDAGYKYLQLDDGWMAATRDLNGRQYADTIRFPHGIKFLADYVHQRGLKLGIYTSDGSNTCAGYPGSYNHEEADANTYASWGVDYLKYDACGEKEGHSDKELNQRMFQALQKTGRPILFETCVFYDKEAYLWASGFANMWRTGQDIVQYIDKHPDVTYQNWYISLQQVIGKESIAVKGHWNDPDNLIVGYPRRNLQSFEEEQSQFSFWCFINAPLMVSADIRNMTADTKKILLNSEVIALNQDKAGLQGQLKIKNPVQEIWVKKLSDGSSAILLFNKSDSSRNLTLNLKDINYQGRYQIRDLWQHAEKGKISKTYQAIAAPHGVILLQLTEIK